MIYKTNFLKIIMISNTFYIFARQMHDKYYGKLLSISDDEPCRSRRVHTFIRLL